MTASRSIRVKPRTDGPFDARKPRDELVEGVAGRELAVDGLSVRIGSLPLFKRSPEGGLEQAVRVVIASPSEGQDLTVSLLEGQSLMARDRIPITRGRQRALLFVPEVDREQTITAVLHRESSELLRTSVRIQPQRKWSIYLIHHSHLDIGYTDRQSSVLRHHRAYLDSVLDLMSITDEWPDDARFRWNIEANLPLRDWMGARPKRVVDDLIARAREGRVEVTALPFSMHTEVYSIDELARLLWFADDLRDRHRIPITTAMQTDVPGATDGLLHLLAGAGIRYLSVAHNYAGRSVPYLVGGERLTRPFYWRSPDGGRLLVWYTDTPHGMAYMEGNLLGLAEDYESVLTLLPEYLTAVSERPHPYIRSIFGWDGTGGDDVVARPPYPFDLLHLRVQGTLADNAAPSLIPAEIVRRWNSTWAFPKLRMATNREFFSAVEAELGDCINSYEGDWTDWWADGTGSDARSLGFNRRAQSEIRVAQALHGLADCTRPNQGTGDDGEEGSPWGEVDRAYERMALFDEHTWGAANPWEDSLDETESGALQWSAKAAFARDALETSERLVEWGLHRLVPGSSTPGSTSLQIIVFNTSARARTDEVRVFVHESRVPRDRSLILLDARTGESVPCVEEPQRHPRFRPRGRYLTFVAKDLPPLGYALYRLNTVEGHRSNEEDERDEDPVIENEHYRVEVDVRRGVISRLTDRQTGRDLVGDAAPFGLNQYIYDRYATAAHFNHLSSFVKAPDLALLGSRSLAGHGVLISRRSNGVSERMTVRLAGDGIDWLETTLRLVRGVKRLDICNRLYKVGSSEKESAFFAFPFAITDPRIQYETTGGIGAQHLPHVPGSAQHMRAIRHWVTMDTGSTSIAWATREAPLIQLGNLHLPYAPFPQTLAPEPDGVETIYSWIMNNIWDTNFPPKQQGEMEFAYAIASGDEEDAVELAGRTADALSSPLRGVITAATIDDLPARGSFCSVEDAGIEVLTVTRSRRGHGLTLLVRSLRSSPTEATISFPLLKIRHAWLGNHLERDLESRSPTGNEIRVPLAPGELRTVSLEISEPLRLGG